MKVIFLDFDGVLNSIESFELMHNHNELRRDTPHKMHIDPLNKIIQATDAKLVISSTWRKSCSSSMLGRFLRLCGCEGEAIGKTPVLDTDRGLEIKVWLEVYNHCLKKGNEWFAFGWKPKESIENFIILDDDSDMDPFMDRLVQTKDGLREEHIKPAIELLNEAY